MMTTSQPLTQQPVTRPFRTPVRGHAFAARVPGAADPTPGQFARLVREPANPADRYAVSVWIAGSTGKWRIGYLDRTVAARIAPRLDRGARIAAKIDGWTAEPDGRWQRPLVVLLPNDEHVSPTASGQQDAPRLVGDHDASRRDTAPGLVETGRGAARRPAATTAFSASASRADAANETGSVAPGLWGRPPGVSRRVVRDGSAPPRR